MTHSTIRVSHCRDYADVFGLERCELLILSASLSEVLADACEGAEQDSRETVRPNTGAQQ